MAWRHQCDRDEERRPEFSESARLAFSITVSVVTFVALAGWGPSDPGAVFERATDAVAARLAAPEPTPTPAGQQATDGVTIGLSVITATPTP